MSDKIAQAIEQLRNADVNDRQPVSNALQLLEEHQEESGSDPEPTQTDKSDAADAGV